MRSKKVILVLVKVIAIVMGMNYIRNLSDKVNEQEKIIKSKNNEIRIYKDESKYNSKLINDIYNNIYLMKNGKAYTLVIEHDNDIIEYKGNGKLFGGRKKIIGHSK